LKDEKDNDSWHYLFLSQALAQGVEDLLNPKYTASGPDETALFQEQLKYIYAVLEQKVQTLKRWSIVCEHEHVYNAQEVYRKLSEHHIFTQPKLDFMLLESSGALPDWIGNGTWKGSTKQFLKHWKSQVCLYERQLPSSDHFSDFHKKAMLENAVHGVPELQQVKQNSDLHWICTGNELSFDEYYTLLYAASVALDHGFQQKRDKRHALLHELEEVGDNIHDEDNTHGDDSCGPPHDSHNSHEIMAFATNQSPRPSNGTPPPTPRLTSSTSGP
jgi:hypothetical protein